MAAGNTTKKQRGKPFKKGQSGNPNGRPNGSRNKTTLAMEALMDGEAEAITRTCIDEAKAGNMVAVRICMERLYPPRKDAPINFEVPKMETTADAVSVMGAVLEAMAAGDISPSEAQAVAGIVETFRRTIETNDIERRIAELEANRV